ncbi:3-Methyladenine DNA glycosylase [Candidatus Liberibacter americanus str. Sao Paulo]|uniref:3-Methyladenine DNA glycosylase n=2 Tax=Candidatus Liberibacter americanus TaxID=309868 RepID=U6B743_9HYPH|nr:3-Methyladenine DNA glycosylase [Candidatus Liberibacter americanus str. Sao Paulo]
MIKGYNINKLQEINKPLKLLRGEDNKLRCHWQSNIEDYLLYHDQEWGFPVFNDDKLFENICLEIFQAGISWLTILRKRQLLREIFCEFQIERIASFTEKDISRILHIPKAIHNRRKILSIINNARKTIKIKEELGSLSCYIWKYEETKEHKKESTTTASIQLTENLKKRGFTFIGPTIIKSFMEASGLINGHIKGCINHDKINKIRNNIKQPLILN